MQFDLTIKKVSFIIKVSKTKATEKNIGLCFPFKKAIMKGNEKMLTIKKELDLNDFMNEYEDILPSDYEACEIIFDNLEDIFCDGTDDMTIRDYVRFQMMVSTAKELLNDYDIIDEEDLQELDSDEVYEKIEEFLQENTMLLGSYEDDDCERVFIYDEF